MDFLKVEDLSRSFTARGARLDVLQKLTLNISQGEFLCLVGPSGCGKTTLLNLISGLDTPSSGKVIHKGMEVKRTSPERLVIFQDLGLFPWLTAEKNVEFGLKMKNIPRKEREETACYYLSMVKLLKFKDSYIHELSGGMKQRVALARALAMDPEILLMDEPFAALDAQTRDNLHEELQKIWMSTKKTIVFVTHNVREAVCLGDRVILLSAQPSRIKSEYKVDLPRLRQIESSGVIEIVRKIHSELKSEIEIASKKETNGQENI